MRNIKNKVLFSILNIFNLIYFKLKKVEYGNNLKIFGKMHMQFSKNSLKIGDNCVIRSNIITNPLGGMNYTCISICPGGKVFIGNNVGVSNSCIRIKEELVIEDFVNIGGDCKIYDSDMHSINFKDRINLPDKTFKSKKIVIKEGAWIGAHSIILKGVVIGKRSVVGAGSVVTKSVPDDELWAGNPAKFIRKINNE